jgi:hypothetical protein
MSTQYRLVQSGKTASGGCSAGQGSSEPVAPRISIIIFNYSLPYIPNIITSTVSLESMSVPFISRGKRHFSSDGCYSCTKKYEHGSLAGSGEVCV